MDNVSTKPTPARYAIVEQLGHRRYGARISETEVCGVKLLRCEVLAPAPFVIDVHPQSLYALTTCTEEQARKANTAWTTPEEIRPQLEAGSPFPLYEDGQDGDECDEGAL